jgi:hypothetical protein
MRGGKKLLCQSIAETWKYKRIALMEETPARQ